MEIYSYHKGQKVANFVGRGDITQFDLADDGADLLVFFNNPNENEIEQFSSGTNFEIRFTELYNIIMITVKIGTLNWMDAPYTPHLSKNLTKLMTPREGEGLALRIMLIDSSNGEIKIIRLVTLSERFTRNLFRVVKEQKEKPFDKAEYDVRINRIYSAYSTKKIAGMCNDYCKIN